jgi:hypothetical protein
MLNTTDKIRLRVNDFVTVLSDLIREATVAEIIEAMKGATLPASARRTSPPAQPRMVRAARVAADRKSGYQAKAPVAAAASHGGQQRTPELLAQLMGRVHGHIQSNPGRGVGAIAASLGTSSKDLSLVLRKLVNDNKIVSKGKKRGTRYFPR